MRGYTLTNVLYPADAQDVATKEYVDNKRTHIIVAYASYHGDLEKDDYQFTFGGSSVKTNKKHSQYNGFMLPHSGYIKSLVFQCTGLKFLIKGPLSAFDHARISNNPIPLFTLVLIKSSLNYTETLEIGKINITFNSFYTKVEDRFDGYIFSDINFGDNWEGKDNIFARYDFSFTATLPSYPLVGLNNFRLESKDILNIKTEFTNITKDKTFNIIPINLFLDEYIKVEEFFTYLFTFLIELDPL